jgi:hypothetical protein
MFLEEEIKCTASCGRKQQISFSRAEMKKDTSEYTRLEG